MDGELQLRVRVILVPQGIGISSWMLVTIYNVIERAKKDIEKSGRNR
jgi:hypothetical protein